MHQNKQNRIAKLESLESRTLMSVSAAANLAASDLSARLENKGFVPVKWQGHKTYAAPGEWILQLQNPGAAAPDEQLSAVNALLDQVRPDAQATQAVGSDGIFLVQTPTGAKNSAILSAIKQLKGVKLFEPNFALYTQATPNDTYYAQHNWHLNNTGQTGGTLDADIDAAEAWNTTTGSPGVVVGVIDSGIDYTHPDLAANMWRNPGEVANDRKDNDKNGYVDDVYGYDFANFDSNPIDDNGHGTHVAGTIAAVGDNNRGVTGVSWNSRLMALKFLAADGYGDLAGAIRALDYARNMKLKYGVNVRLTNNSWGGGDYSQSLYDAIARQQSAGMLFVAASGNGDANGVAINNDVYGGYPSGYNLDNVVAVAATDHNDRLASFSNYGATTVDLAAPGVDIASTVPGGGYAYMSGTSMATPSVSGVAALAWSAAPTATFQQVKAALLGGVDPVSTLTGKVLTGGRLNAKGTLDFLFAPSKPTAGSSYTITEGQGVTLTRTNSTDPNGDPVTYTWDVNGDGAFGDETRGTASGTALSYTWAQLQSLGIADGLATHAVRVRAGDGKGNLTTSDAATLTVQDVRPTTTLSGAASADAGAPYELTLGAVIDPGADTLAQYVVKWGDGRSDTFPAAQVAAAAGKVTHTFANIAAGTRNITVDLVDEDGTHAAAATRTVNVVATAPLAPPQNLALGKTATQSSTGWGGVASRAMDGNTDGAYWNESVSTTLYDANAWWEVDLGAVQNVQTVKISNRTDYEPWRLADFYVLASDTPFASTDLPATLAQDGVSAYYFEGPAGTSLEMAIGRTARYLRVQLTGTNYLSLAEVEVMGTPAQAAAPVTATSGVFSTRPIAASSAKRAAREDAVWA